MCSSCLHQKNIFSCCDSFVVSYITFFCLPHFSYELTLICRSLSLYVMTSPGIMSVPVINDNPIYIYIYIYIYLYIYIHAYIQVKPSKTYTLALNYINTIYGGVTTPLWFPSTSLILIFKLTGKMQKFLANLKMQQQVDSWNLVILWTYQTHSIDLLKYRIYPFQ